ncbi:hypothetical protein BGZ81_004805 [Podila clonocystis]|nr:hypothetical protein BGZ81_004805 [Podila clonocystis]
MIDPPPEAIEENVDFEPNVDVDNSGEEEELDHVKDHESEDGEEEEEEEEEEESDVNSEGQIENERGGNRDDGVLSDIDNDEFGGDVSSLSDDENAVPREASWKLGNIMRALEERCRRSAVGIF